MIKQAELILDELTARYPVLQPVRGDIAAAYEILKECYDGDHKLLIAGNGGSCADSEHIVGELMKGFRRNRPLSEEQKKSRHLTRIMTFHRPENCSRGCRRSH